MESVCDRTFNGESESISNECMVPSSGYGIQQDSSIVNEEIDSEAHENLDHSQEEEERNAVIAAAVADFDADDQDDENEGDDTVNVIIKPTSKGSIYKTGATYQARSISHVTQHQKVTRQGIELDDPGNIHGVPTMEFNLSTLGDEEKPWKRPGADVTDYFNYGFTEDTWIQYCEKQKILRQEYANTTLKPVMSSGGAGLLQRIRTGAATSSIRPIDSSKQASINVIHLSNAARTNSANAKTNSSGTDVGLLNGNAVSSANLLNQFNQPPPCFLSGSQSSGGNTANTGVFNMPPPGFPPGATSQLLNAANSSAAAAALFPNLAVPPPVVNSLAGWPSGNISISNLMASGDALIDPTTGQITSLLEQGDRSPGSTYSNEDSISRRSRRHYHAEEIGYYDRDNYRTRRRSRSNSRERFHSRRRRHRESPHASRDYDRRISPSRRSHRSREERYSGCAPGPDEHVSSDAPLNTSVSSSRRSTDRRSDRDRDRFGRDRVRSDRSRERDRSRHRSERRERERSVRSSRQTERHSSRRKEIKSPSKSPSQLTKSPPRNQTPKPDPLSAAAMAAANIAAALASSGSTG